VSHTTAVSSSHAVSDLHCTVELFVIARLCDS